MTGSMEQDSLRERADSACATRAGLALVATPFITYK
jgi:hypothetical protein